MNIIKPGDEERALAASELRYRRLFEAAQDGILILDEPTGQIVDVNPFLIDMLGYSREEYLGKKLWEIGFLKDVAASQAAFEELRSKGYVRYESLPLKTKGGRKAEVEFVSNAYDAGGQKVIQCNIRDITARRAAEKTARVAEESFRAIFDSVGDGIFVSDANTGTITDVNRVGCEMFGYGREEIVGTDIGKFSSGVPPYTLEATIPQFQKAREGHPQQFEWHCRAKDGHLFWAEIALRCLAIEGRLVGLASVRDITEKKLGEQRLRGSMRALKALSQTNAALIRVRDRDELQQKICKAILDAGAYRLVWIGESQHDEKKTIRPLAWAGLDSEHVAQLGITWADSDRGLGPTGMAIKSGLPQVVQRIADGPADEPWRSAALKHGYLSGIALPLKDRTGIFGALSVHAGEPDCFGPEAAELLAQLAEDLSFGLVTLQTRADHEAALERLALSMEETVHAIASTVEMRDSYTAGHQRRVAKIAVAIAAEMGLGAERIHGLRLAGTVHDIGKINIPAEFLSKPGKLSTLEYEMIKTHPQAGYDILKPVKFSWPIAEIVRQHHERLDGSGYPNGLKGDGILLEARILAVADVFDSMMSHRPYRPALGLDAALAEIEQGSGRLYDPVVVEACVKVMRGGKVELDA